MLLVSTYTLGHQPLVLAVAQRALRDAGFAPQLLDIQLEPATPERLRGHALVAIAAPMHTGTRLAAGLCRTVKAADPSTRICVFGLHAPPNREHLFASGADVVVGPDFTGALVALARAVTQDRPLQGIPGALLPGDTTDPVPGRPAVLRPDRTGLLPLARYAQLERDGVRTTAGYVETTVGCKHVCRHCPLTPVYRGRFFALDRAVVLDDIDGLVAAGAGHITFGDPDFLNGPGHALRITDELHRRHPGVTWDATVKVEHLLLHADLLGTFRDRGCVFMVSAVESLSDEVLRQLHKGHTGADVRRALALTRQAGIPLRPTFVAFTPWTTAADHLALCDLVDQEGLHDVVDPVQMTLRLLIPPGSALLETCAGQPWLGPVNVASLTHAWTHPDVRMDALCQELGDVAAAGASSAEGPRDTLQKIAQVSRARLGGVPPRGVAPSTGRAPRLTEHWFC
ncbi:MAG: radical SAM protein [Deltaproteobacteria bacterium]|nr:radical SAM protein [Deltaproteobacteria bacterium]